MPEPPFQNDMRVQNLPPRASNADLGFVQGSPLVLLVTSPQQLPAARMMRNDGPLELGDRGRAPPDGLADLEAFELRMVHVKRFVLARIPVGGAEFG